MVSPTRSFAGQTHNMLSPMPTWWALRPSRLSYVEAASAPVIAVTAWQMLFECGNAKPNQTVMILGAAGNVGAYAVQLAVNVGLQVIGVVVSKDIEYVKALGSQTIVNHQAGKFENAVRHVDLILDTVGGETRERSYSVLKSGGVLVSVVSIDPIPERPDARSVFFYAEVTTERLNGIARLFCSGQLTPQVGTLLPLNDVRTAHEMLAGALRDVHGNLLNEPDFTSCAWRAPRTAERTNPLSFSPVAPSE